MIALKLLSWINLNINTINVKSTGRKMNFWERMESSTCSFSDFINLVVWKDKKIIKDEKIERLLSKIGS